MVMQTVSFDGLLVVDKPRGITSRDAVDRAQRWFPRRTRIGHAGTLDPLATGVLVLCVGSATRLIEYVQRMAKTYRTTIRLGATSDTDDADGTVTPQADTRVPKREEVEEQVRAFVGEIEQVPPAFSAAKVTGRRAYDMARAGEEVQLAPRTVRIFAFEVLRYEFPLLDAEVRCGKGTYIRSLARDLGERLGCGGLVEVLRRTRIGPFRAEDGVSLDADAETARAKLLPPVTALSELSRVVVAKEADGRARNGAAIPLTLCTWPDDPPPSAGECALFTEAGVLLGIGSIDPQGRQLRPSKVLS
jgi:tRNA pseudouridine55 synthase